MATATQPTVDELEKREEEAFKTGPLSVLTTSVKSNSTVCAAARSIQAQKPCSSEVPVPMTRGSVCFAENHISACLCRC